MKVNEGLVVAPVGMLKSQSIIYYMGFHEYLCKLGRIFSVWTGWPTYWKRSWANELNPDSLLCRHQVQTRVANLNIMISSNLPKGRTRIVSFRLLGHIWACSQISGGYWMIISTSNVWLHVRILGLVLNPKYCRRSLSLTMAWPDQPQSDL